MTRNTCSSRTITSLRSGRRTATQAHPASASRAGTVDVVWEEIVGTARAKWLLWTGDQIDAQTALQWGVVSEALPHERALERGIEVARTLAAKPALYPTLQKQTLSIISVAGSIRTCRSGWRSRV